MIFKTSYSWKLATLLPFLFLFALNQSYAQNTFLVTLAWDPVENVDGYLLYYGVDSRHNPDNTTPYQDAEIEADQGPSPLTIQIDDPEFDPGNPEYALTFMFPESLEKEPAYFFAVKAYVGENQTSGYSNEEATLCITWPESGFIVNASNYTSYRIWGRANAGALVNLFVRQGETQTPLGQATADGDRDWSITDVDFSPLEEGLVTLWVESSAMKSADVTASYDRTPPPAPVITTNGGNDFPTENSSLALEGRCSAEDTAIIYVNASRYGVTYVPGESSWTFAGTLDRSENIFAVTARDEVGNLSAADTITVTYPEPPEIVQVIPHDGAGITYGSSVPNNTSFSVLIEDTDGIDITQAQSVTFIINDGIGPFERDLGDTDVVRIVKLTADADTSVTRLWVAYDRTREPVLGDYPYDSDISITVDVQDKTGDTMQQTQYAFHISANAQGNLPPTTEIVNSPEPGLTTLSVTGGGLEGAKIIYDSNEPVPPKFGPLDQVPPLNVSGTDGVEVPLNLQPPTVFNAPVKIFIPCPGYDDVSGLSVYLHDGAGWVLACNPYGFVQPGGKDWMVPWSRKNHDGRNPSTIEIQVYHFSAAQAGIPSSSPGAWPDGYSGKEGGGGGCFIDTATSP